MSFLQDLRSGWRRSGSPVSLSLAAGLVASALMLFFTQMRPLPLMLFDGGWTSQPWTWLTYPFAYAGLVGGFGLIGLVFTVMMIVQFGGQVERDLGSSRYSILLATFTFIPAAIMFVGWTLLRSPGNLGGPYLVLAGLVVAWGIRNKSAQIMLYGILPLTGRWLAWLSVGGVFFAYGFPNPVLGLLACAHLGLAWAFAENRLPFFLYRAGYSKPKPSKTQVKRENEFFDDVRKREKDREERERLRKLFESSLEDDK